MQFPVIEVRLKGWENQWKEQLILPFETVLDRTSCCQRLNYLDVEANEELLRGRWCKKRIRVFFLPLLGKVESRSKLFWWTFCDISNGCLTFHEYFTDISSSSILQTDYTEEWRQEDYIASGVSFPNFWDKGTWMCHWYNCQSSWTHSWEKCSLGFWTPRQ